MDPYPFLAQQPPGIGHIEVRYVAVNGEKAKIDRNGVTLTECLRKEMSLQGVHAVYWGRQVEDALKEVFMASPYFWQHIQIHSKDMWQMEQTVRRVLKKDAKLFTNNQKEALIAAVKSRGEKFENKFSYISKDWVFRYHRYVLEPHYAISRSILIPTEDSMWYATIQLYPRIFYEERDKNVLWRKGGIKLERLAYNQQTDEWSRSDDNYKAAKTFEIAWYCNPEIPILTPMIAGVHHIVDDVISETAEPATKTETSPDVPQSATKAPIKAILKAKTPVKTILKAK